MAMSIPQQGSGFPFFTTTAYHYLASKEISKLEVILEDIPNPEVRRFLTEVRACVHIANPGIGPSSSAILTYIF